MTWRAFILGLAAVAGLCLLDPYTSYIRGYGWLIVGSFPVGAVVLIVGLTALGNAVLSLARRGWELTQPELMVVWCMLIVAAAVPTEGVGRFVYTMMAGGPYMARRPELQWEEPDGSLAHAPEGLVLSKEPRSVAALRYYEGSPEGGRVPWRVWTRPLLHWAAFLVPMYLAVIFLCAMLRRQWVESERLMFPLARVPLEFTEGCGPGRPLPALFYDRAFLVGAGLTAAFRLVRAVPLFFGGSGWGLVFPIAEVLRGTPLEPAGFDDVYLQLPHVGFAFLVPADVSLGVWVFFLFSRLELLAGNWLALPEAGGGTWSPMMRWQQFGAYAVFMAGMLFMARRHLARLVGKALGLSGADDSDEPVGYRVAFWGFVASIGVCVAWYAWHGVRPGMALVLLGLIMCSYLVYARIVAQGGVPVTRNLWHLTTVPAGFAGEAAFTPAEAVVASMQSSCLITSPSTVMGPMAMMALRISEVLKRGRRLLLPALVAALLLAMVCTTWTVLRQAYAIGAVNFSDTYWPEHLPQGIFGEAQRVMDGQTTEWHRLHVRPLVMGSVGMAFLLFMRARFYWWPIHPIGLLTASSWNMMHRLWLAFFLGWFIKVAIMKLGGGRMLRQGRRFFIGLIVVESFLTGVSALVGTVSGGAVPGF